MGKLVNDNAFIDFPQFDLKFTWRDNQVRMTRNRIDRFIVSKEWEHFPSSIQYSLARGVLDHKPIKLNSKEINWRTRLFKLAYHREFPALVKA